MTEFDPTQHRMIPEQRWFDDFQLGERFVLPSRTMTEAVFLAFQAASGDNHPVHYDVEFCKARGMPGLLAVVPQFEIGPMTNVCHAHAIASVARGPRMPPPITLPSPRAATRAGSFSSPKSYLI